MKQKEKELFKSLCSFIDEEFNENLLDAATPTVLGHLFFNRMQAVAFGTLHKHDLIGKVNREFRNSLEEAYKQNCKKNSSFFQCVELVQKALTECTCKYAMLKGAYLCKIYPQGYRTSNDIDLLVHPSDVTEVGNILLKAGFKQGNIYNGKFEPATRREIIQSKMMRGETVPYIKEINLPGMKFLEVDINFSLEYKPGDTNLIEEILNKTVFIELDNFKVRTLRADDFFVHLCSHLYKEATTLPWVEMMRDMTLYKYCDIYMLLNNADKEHIDFLFRRAKELGLEKICGFAVLQMAELFVFKNQYALENAKKALGNDLDFIHRIFSPKDKKELIYTERDILERFFLDKRKDILEEVELCEKA